MIDHTTLPTEDFFQMYKTSIKRGRKGERVPIYLLSYCPYANHVWGWARAGARNPGSNPQLPKGWQKPNDMNHHLSLTGLHWQEVWVS